jgi:hypothetical protein
MTTSTDRAMAPTENKTIVTGTAAQVRAPVDQSKPLPDTPARADVHHVQDPAEPVKRLADALDGTGGGVVVGGGGEGDNSTAGYPHTDTTAHSTPSDPTHPDHEPVVPLTDPSAPSSDTTVLPTAPSVHPSAQAEALDNAHPEVVGREVEKTKADKREVEGRPAGGTVVVGLEDDKLWTLLRRFDMVRLVFPHSLASMFQAR